MRSSVWCVKWRTDLDVPEGLAYHHAHDLLLLQMVYEVSVQCVEVVLDAGPLHDQVLSHPWQEVITHKLLQLCTLPSHTTNTNLYNCETYRVELMVCIKLIFWNYNGSQPLWQSMLAHFEEVTESVIKTEWHWSQWIIVAEHLNVVHPLLLFYFYQHYLL